MTQKRPETIAQRAVRFYMRLSPPHDLPEGVASLNPYTNTEVMRCVQLFYETFYADTHPRLFVFGINPGRFGSGATGIPFTDALALKDHCGIPNTLPQTRELTSEFMYRFIARWGDVPSFYAQFFLTAVSPLGLVRQGVNYNYYDDPETLQRITPFILHSLRAQVAFGARRDAAIVLGQGKNYRAFSAFNNTLGLFRTLYPLAHPRYIMQYQRGSIESALQKYEDTFRAALLQAAD